MLKLAPLIIRNVMRSRRRTLLTLASTAVSLALLSLMVAMYQGFFYGENVSEAQALRMVTRHKVSLTQPLPASHQAEIMSVAAGRVSHISAYSWFQGKYIDERHFFARFAVDADQIFDIYSDWGISPEQLAAFKRNRTGCAIGEKIATDYNIKLGDKVNIQGDIYPVNLELTVEAIYTHPPATECLVFHREYLSELLLAKGEASTNMVGTYVMSVYHADEVPAIASDIDAKFANSSYPTKSSSEKEFGRSFLAFLGNIKLFLMAICAAVTFTILLVSANTVAMSVRERTREMAILRTLGYTPTEIMMLVLGEAVLLSVVGGIVGLGLGMVLSRGLQAVGAFFGYQGIKWQSALVVLAAAAVVGIVASVVPAFFASRKNVVESLRFTG